VLDAAAGSIWYEAGMRTLLLSAVLVGCGSSSPAPVSSTSSAAAAYTPTSFTAQVTGSGRPVVFIPGLTCDGHVWDATVAHLGGKVQAHVLSLAGFAGNPPIDRPLLPTVHDEIVEYIRKNHLERPILVGHSLGGFMTFWVAETDPDLLAGAVAVDGAPFFGSLMDPKATVESSTEGAKAMRDRMTGSPEQFAAGIHAFSGSMMNDPAKNAALIDSWAKSDPKTTGEAMFFLMQTDLRPELAKIKAPVLTIVADGNGQIPRDALDASWHAEIDAVPHHELVVIEHSKHFVMLDQADAFYVALDKFLAAH
jgi:pimeloyl-ACP methyl ester carboxylesterase